VDSAEISANAHSPFWLQSRDFCTHSAAGLPATLLSQTTADMDIENSTVLITGETSGIGL